MGGRFTKAISLVLASTATPGCWIVLGESFDGYQAQAEGNAPLGPYVTESRNALDDARTYLLARPDPTPAGLPLVFSMHGEGFTGAQMRTQLPLEQHATSGAVFVYPNSPPGETFDYNNNAGRSEEADLVQEVIQALSAELRIDTARVFMAGWDDGAIMTNALACRLGPGVLRGVAIQAGTLYPSLDQADFTIDPNTGVASCQLPAALVAWGDADPIEPLSIDAGRDTKDVYASSHDCSEAAVPWPPPPCITYNECRRSVVWCEIPGLDHSLWPGAARAMWSFFDGLR